MNRDGRVILRMILGGVKSTLPWIPRDYSGTGGSSSAEYCYAIWLRHLRLLAHAQLHPPFRCVVELGPGDTIGLGIMALLTGTEEYIALDVVRHADMRRNLELLEELAAMLSQRRAIPSLADLPGVHPAVSDDSFPSALLTDAVLSAALAPARLEEIRKALRAPADGFTPGAMVTYLCPWFDGEVLPDGVADLVVSQVVLQDVADDRATDALASLVQRMARWTRPGGATSHQIDLACPGGAMRWNAHWSLPTWAWKMVRGSRPYYVNRVAASRYRRLFEMAGFDLRTVQELEDASGLATLASRSMGPLEQRDYLIRGLYVAGTVCRR